MRHRFYREPLYRQLSAANLPVNVVLVNVSAQSFVEKRKVRASERRGEKEVLNLVLNPLNPALVYLVVKLLPKVSNFCCSSRSNENVARR